MKMLKNIVAIGVLMLAIGATTITAFAAYATPAELVAGITGRTVESVVAERVDTGKTYGTIANEAGKLDEFKSASLNMKKENLEAQVADGAITQAEADEIISIIENNQAICNGTGTARIGQNIGSGLNCNGTGIGRAQGGMGRRTGTGRGQGIGGMRLRDGSCYVPAN